jgi:ATP-binding cassette subfamily F protein 3
LAGANLLILDEPTNHLDVEMIEALERALGSYQGTLLIVSHDRRFLRSTCDRIWEVRDGVFEDYEGDFERYLRLRRRRAEAAAESERATERARAEAEQSAASAVRGPSTWQLERERERLEAEIARLEGELGSVADTLAEPARLAPEEIQQLGARHARLEGALLEAIDRWERVAHDLERRSG